LEDIMITKNVAVADKGQSGISAAAIQYPSAAYAWGAIALLTLISAFAYIDRVVLGMLVKPIRADLNISDTEFSYLHGLAFALLYTTVGIPLGWLSDRFHRGYLLSAGCAVWSFLTAACGLVSSFTGLFLCRIGVGLGEATMQPSAYPLVGSLFPKERAGRAMAVYTMGHPIGGGLAMIMSGFLIGSMAAVETVQVPILGEARPWQVVFFVAGLPGLLLALLGFLYLRDPAQHAKSANRRSFGTAFRFMWRERKVYTALALSLGSIAAFAAGGLAWFPAFLMRVHGFSPAEAGLLIGLSSALGGITGSFVLGVLVDRLISKGPQKLIKLILIPVALGAMLCGAIAPVLPIRWLSVTLFAGVGFFMLTPTGVYHVIRQFVTPQQVWGQVTAIYLCFTNLLGLTLGPTAIALCTDYLFKDDNKVNYSIAVVGSLCMGIVMLSLWLGRHRIAERFGNPAPL
jgi:MFS family permease